MKKKIIILAILSIILTTYVVIDTFSLLESKGIAVINQSIGKWVIKVNNKNISTGNTTDFVIDNFIYTTNSHTKGNKIAPGISAYTNILLDPTTTDTSVRYDITVDTEVMKKYPNLEFKVTTEQGNVIKTAKDTYSGIFTLNDIKNGILFNLKVSINWINNENNNVLDSSIGTQINNKLSVPIKFHVIQYTGEELIPYNE